MSIETNIEATSKVDPITRPFDDRAMLLLVVFYGGKHHVPIIDRDRVDGSWVVQHHFEISTFDNSELTKLVLLAHHFGVRVSLKASDEGPDILISLSERCERDGAPWDMHPTMETAIQNFRI